ncbi:hypothetical protein [Thalassotalea maritima]|uniref:hypothetical protein n=1 Tax=Thalassotalea maritima TaxID=3242416 RepID=UPI00352797F0
MKNAATLVYATIFFSFPSAAVYWDYYNHYGILSEHIENTTPFRNKDTNIGLKSIYLEQKNYSIKKLFGEEKRSLFFHDKQVFLYAPNGWFLGANMISVFSDKEVTTPSFKPQKTLLKNTPTEIIIQRVNSEVKSIRTISLENGKVKLSIEDFFRHNIPSGKIGYRINYLADRISSYITYNEDGSEDEVYLYTYKGNKVHISLKSKKGDKRFLYAKNQDGLIAYRVEESDNICKVTLYNHHDNGHIKSKETFKPEPCGTSYFLAEINRGRECVVTNFHVHFTENTKYRDNISFKPAPCDIYKRKLHLGDYFNEHGHHIKRYDNTSYESIIIKISYIYNQHNHPLEQTEHKFDSKGNLISEEIVMYQLEYHNGLTGN